MGSPNKLSSLLKDEDFFLVPHMEKNLKLLMPWCVEIDADDTNHTDRLKTDQVNQILHYSTNMERNLALAYIKKYELATADDHCKRALISEQRYGGEHKVSLMKEAFSMFSRLRTLQHNLGDAEYFAGEAYNCVAEAFNPVHHEVQTCAGDLIEILIHKGDLEKAELYAQMTLDR
jgi:hypothetical protein